MHGVGDKWWQLGQRPFTAEIGVRVVNVSGEWRRAGILRVLVLVQVRVWSRMIVVQELIRGKRVCLPRIRPGWDHLSRPHQS
jgi:hypothetical protein